MKGTQHMMWIDGKYRLPSIPGVKVYVTQVLVDNAVEWVQVDLIDEGRARKLALVEKCRWQDFPNEAVLAKIALVMG